MGSAPQTALMRLTNHTFTFVIFSLIISAGTLFGGVKIQVRDGRPIVDGVFVNGHGPYRFTIDTGTNVDLIETRLADSIGLAPTFQTRLGSSTGSTVTAGADGVEVALGDVKAAGQKFVFSGLDAMHNTYPDVQGVLGQWFLSRFDYLLDLKGKRIEFGRQEVPGAHVPVKMINGRPVLPTSLGSLVVDSGASRVTLFGIQPEYGGGFGSQLRSVTGSRNVGFVIGKPLLIGEKKIRHEDPVAMPNRPEADVDGLLPVGVLQSIYFCNSEGYAVIQ